MSTIFTAAIGGWVLRAAFEAAAEGRSWVALFLGILGMANLAATIVLKGIRP